MTSSKIHLILFVIRHNSWCKCRNFSSKTAYQNKYWDSNFENILFSRMFDYGWFLSVFRLLEFSASNKKISLTTIWMCFVDSATKCWFLQPANLYLFCLYDTLSRQVNILFFSSQVNNLHEKCMRFFIAIFDILLDDRISCNSVTIFH